MKINTLILFSLGILVTQLSYSDEEGVIHKHLSHDTLKASSTTMMVNYQIKEGGFLTAVWNTLHLPVQDASEWEYLLQINYQPTKTPTPDQRISLYTLGVQNRDPKNKNTSNPTRNSGEIYIKEWSGNNNVTYWEVDPQDHSRVIEIPADQPDGFALIPSAKPKKYTDPGRGFDTYPADKDSVCFVEFPKVGTYSFHVKSSWKKDVGEIKHDGHNNLPPPGQTGGN